MANRTLIILGTLCVVLVAACAGTVTYCTAVIGSKDFDLRLVRLQVSDLTSQVSNYKFVNGNLTAEVDRLSGLISDLNGMVANVNDKVTQLTEAKIVTSVGSNYVTTGTPRLYIAGSVVNTGRGTAYNAGLHVIAYSANRQKVIDMTIPFYFDNTYNPSLTTLSAVPSMQNMTVNINIKTTVALTNWTITPVWTNNP